MKQNQFVRENGMKEEEECIPYEGTTNWGVYPVELRLVHPRRFSLTPLSLSSSEI